VEAVAIGTQSPVKVLDLVTEQAVDEVKGQEEKNKIENRQN